MKGFFILWLIAAASLFYFPNGLVAAFVFVIALGYLSDSWLFLDNEVKKKIINLILICGVVGLIFYFLTWVRNL